jgi:predicted nucleic acid-binding protein
MTQTPIVTGSGCLIALERIDRLDILSSLFGEVWIPPAVSQEFGSSLSWLKVVVPKDQGMVAVLSLSVDDGEAQAIALAYEYQYRLIVDDLKARKVAQGLGLKITGTIGILIFAQKRGIITSIQDAIVSLEAVGFYMSDALKLQALKLVDNVSADVSGGGDSAKPTLGER